MSDLDLVLNLGESVEFEEVEGGALVVKRVPALIEGTHKGHEFTPDIIEETAKNMQDVTDVQLFKSHEEAEQNLVGGAVNFTFGESNGKKAVLADLVIGDTDTATLVKNLKNSGLKNLAISPRVDVSENKILHVALVLEPAQGEDVRLKADKEPDEEDPEEKPDEEPKQKEKKIEEKKDGSWPAYTPYKTWWENVKAIISKTQNPEEAIKKLKELIEKAEKACRGKNQERPYPNVKAAMSSGVQVVEMLPSPSVNFQQATDSIYRVFLFEEGKYVFGEDRYLVANAKTFKDWKESLSLLKKVPVFLGHPKKGEENAPAVVGWLLDVDTEGKKCYGVMEIVEKEVADAIDKGKILGVSVGTMPLRRTEDGNFISNALDHVALTVDPVLRQTLEEGFEKLERYVASEEEKEYVEGSLERIVDEEEVSRLRREIEEQKQKLSEVVKRLMATENEKAKRDREAIDELFNKAIAEGRITPAEVTLRKPVYYQLLNLRRPVKVGDEEISVVEMLQRELAVRKSESLEPVNQSQEAKAFNIESLIGLPPDEFVSKLRDVFGD